MARFGIEEEFVLLDENTLVPLAMDARARASILGPRAEGGVTPEYLTCQLESATSPAARREDAERQLRRLRGELGAHAAAQGMIAAATGTPFIAPSGYVVSPSAHYDLVSAALAEITREHAVNGLHVHVEIRDDEERVRALNRIRPWLPTLLALTGNAPFTHGRASGYASWRSILIRRLPSSWNPPRFHDFSDYRGRVDQLLATGAIHEPSSLSWAVRLSERYPTVEVRVFDAQLTVDDTLLAVALTRALLLSDELGEAPHSRIDALDASLWTAARNGTDARLVDPTSGDAAPFWDVATTMLRRIGPALAHLGDEAFVTDAIARIRADGTGAVRQLRARKSGGTDALRELYRRTTAST